MTPASKPTWEKSPAQLVALFTELVPKHPAVARKMLFGWPCCFANGNLFFGLHKEGMIFRLADGDRLACLKLPGTADFEPMPGRKMKGYVFLTDPGRHDGKELKRWIGRSLEFSLSLPPKVKAKRTGKSRPSKKNSKG
jgi:TfoX N-terminal domain